MNRELAPKSGMCAEIRCNRDGYIRRLSISGHSLTIIHKKTGETLLQQQEGKTIAIRERDISIIERALESFS